MRTCATVAAGVWIGGLIVIAVVAQTTFSTMRTLPVEQPNAVAGRIMAKNFSRFDTVQIICAVTLVAWQAAALASGQRSRRDIIRTVLILVAAGCMTITVTVMTPKITDLQSRLQGPDAETAYRQAFAAFHQSAVRLSQFTLALALLILLEMSWPPLSAHRANAGTNLASE